MHRIFLTSTSYPRSESDWQGLFIREMLGALARRGESEIYYWGPSGPMPERVEYAGSDSDTQFLDGLAERGGIAHLLRSRPFVGVSSGVSLTRRMRRAIRTHKTRYDLLHLNWLQSALAIPGDGNKALITILGTDYKLLEIPGIAALLRRRFSRNRIVLAPNAGWMEDRLAREFGNQAVRVQCVPFGIDRRFYGIEYTPDRTARRWITVLRITRSKIGPLLEWSRDLAGNGDEFHLFGPMQEEVTLPPWIRYHGPVTPDTLINEWYPQATAMVTLSQHDEGRPQVLLEAMASGIPVIASRIPAHSDLLESAAGGLIVDSKDEFTAAIRTLSDTDTRVTHGRAARESMKTSYGNWDDCAARYHALYSELVPGSNS